MAEVGSEVDDEDVAVFVKVVERETDDGTAEVIVMVLVDDNTIVPIEEQLKVEPDIEQLPDDELIVYEE